MGEITLKGYKCERCEHTWVPRDEGRPTVCPKCKSPYWDRQRIDPAKRKAILKQFKESRSKQ